MGVFGLEFGGKKWVVFNSTFMRRKVKLKKKYLDWVRCPNTCLYIYIYIRKYRDSFIRFLERSIPNPADNKPEKSY